ncbi:MAG: L-fucose:H+ symporter permease [Bacteroidales bacterium]|jgi:FHS family L-fucose permease-like MFS transporter|nr:L-fucose:H+ symporter permease [Bacteroidales bacterium]
MKEKTSIFKYEGVNYLVPFILITACFALWGFANDITNPMVKAFSKIFRMSVTEGALTQVAFYGGYFAMALPAAMYIRKYTYKKGILMGLGLYAAGAFLFIAARSTGAYWPFLIAYFILTCGLSFLETSANPYILAMGSPETATRRLNFAQSFNPIGSLCGMFVAMNFIQARLNPLSSAERAQLPPAEFEAVKQSDLAILIKPYVIIGLVIVVMFFLILLVRMPHVKEENKGSIGETLKDLIGKKRYREGVVAQFFYVGVQIMCWTFIIQYGTRIFMERGMSEIDAEVLSQRYNIAAMIIFCCSRFLCTWLMKYLQPGKMLHIFALAGIACTLGVIFLQGIAGLYCLVAVSACMSLMFPTIYGIALEGLGEDAKFGAAGLIMAILGGSILPPVQALIIDQGTVAGMPAVNASFVLPMLCFVVIAVYGYRVFTKKI